MHKKRNFIATFVLFMTFTQSFSMFGAIAPKKNEAIIISVGILRKCHGFACQTSEQRVYLAKVGLDLGRHVWTTRKRDVDTNLRLLVNPETRKFIELYAVWL